MKKLMPLSPNIVNVENFSKFLFTYSIDDPNISVDVYNNCVLHMLKNDKYKFLGRLLLTPNELGVITSDEVWVLILWNEKKRDIIVPEYKERILEVIKLLDPDDPKFRVFLLNLQNIKLNELAKEFLESEKYLKYKFTDFKFDDDNQFYEVVA